MTQAIESPIAFLYQAQTLEGQPISGTIDALNADQAHRLLSALRLRVLNIEPATGDRAAPAGRALRAEDFMAFNQQLAHLTSAGMPIEQGLRLIAQDMRDGRLAETIRSLAGDLERGTPLEQAFDNRRNQFPPLYSKLIAAGVKSGNLPGMLLNLGRHVELVQRLRAAIWRAAAYPLMVMGGVLIVLTFLSLGVIPQFNKLFDNLRLGTQLPALTRAIMLLPQVMPWVLLVIGVVLAIIVIAWISVRRSGREQSVTERMLLPLPLVGPILRYNILARWCDAAGLAVAGGLDLPRAIELADEAVASPAITADGNALIAALQAGQPLESVGRTRTLPATVVAAISLASKQNDLPAALATLSEMYQQQAQLRLALMPGLLTPILVIIIAFIIGAIIVALFMPFLVLLRLISS